MSANHSTAPRHHAYQPTIIEQRLLLSRLAIQIAFVKHEFEKDPRGFTKRLAEELLTNPRIILACLVATVVLSVVMHATIVKPRKNGAIADEPGSEVLLYDISRPGHAGFNFGSGEGSGPTPQRARGGGGSGNHNPEPPQTGKLPPPATVLAPIPLTPLVNAAALPLAGIKVDPALWRDLKTPAYGDPTSNAIVPSAGLGEGEGIGTGSGLGIGAGHGPGIGAGSSGNTGGAYGMNGCCGDGAGEGGAVGGGGGGYAIWVVDQRPRVVSKAEPQYTEEARRNQVSGTVTLRALFSSDGEVVQIRALNTLPFGLTERAIAAARQIKFVPAMKNGHPVSVFMHLEYNFNLY